MNRELFKIQRVHKKYDRRTCTFIMNIRYATAVEPTPRTFGVAEAFGLGVDEAHEFVLYDNAEIRIRPNDVVYVTGDSGSGKSVLLREIEKDLRAEGFSVLNLAGVHVDEDKPIIDCVGATFDEALYLLNIAGLNDAFLFLRKYHQLSDGQRYRFRLAKLIEARAQYWIADEFCSTLDRDTAKIIAFNFQKVARRRGCCLIVATTHTDLFEDLKPSVYVHKRFGKEVQVQYCPNTINRECSLVKKMRIEQGAHKDYKPLAEFHYRSHKIPPSDKIFVLRYGGELCGIIVYSYPSPLRLRSREKVLGQWVQSPKELNRILRRISRVVVHPKYRGIGLGVKLVRETLPLAGVPYVETLAVMAKYNPFFEKAGMKLVELTEPSPKVVWAINALREIGFNPVYLTSKTTNLQVLRRLNQNQIQQVREILKEVAKLHGKRICGIFHETFPKREFLARMEETAQLNELATMLKHVGLLAQTKAYLFWRNPEWKTI